MTKKKIDIHDYAGQIVKALRPRNTDYGSTPLRRVTTSATMAKLFQHI